VGVLLWRAVLALSLVLSPGLARAAARADGRDAGVKHPDAGASGKAPSKPVARDSGGKQPDGGASSKGPSKPAKAGQPDKKAAPDKKAKKPSRYAPVEIYQINTKETLKLRFYDDKGLPIKGWQKRFDKFMRCHNTGKVFKMDSRLPRMLYQVGRHYDGHRLEVVSGYRHPKVARNPKSPHKQGLACDFRVSGIANTELRDYLRKTFDHAGVGFYPNSVFVHLDNRKQGPKAFWIDYSGPGEAADYAENPGEELRNPRAAGREDPGAEAGAAKSASGPTRKPIEIKAPQDTFGD
jgi:uncharacterized protein YcbK (DUF882 family)